jgi:hypothetical protein
MVREKTNLNHGDSLAEHALERNVDLKREHGAAGRTHPLVPASAPPLHIRVQ